MSNEKDKQPADIVSLNRELMNFDFEDISAEELERRLELQIATMPHPSASCTGNGCNVYWGNGNCTNNTCTGFHVTPPPPPV